MMIQVLRTVCPVRAPMLVFLISWMAAARVAAQHVHIYAGVASRTPSASLWFQNGDVWDTESYGGYAESPACIYFEANIPDVYPGMYQTATTFVALPATIFTGGPSPNAAALGTHIELRFASLQGPADGALTVWNELEDPEHPAPMFVVPVGTAEGTNRIHLSEGDPTDPSSDPYGHVHGRRFTLNKRGLYTIGLQLVDTSRNGPDGGPVQRPSPIRYFYLQAGLVLSDFSVSNGVATARFGLSGSTDYVFEASPSLQAASWVVLTNLVGTSHSELRWVTDANLTPQGRFYRIRKVGD